jgi:hypothetical protein
MTLGSVNASGVGVEFSVGVFVFKPTRVGVEVKVGEGTVGVEVGAAVGVLVAGGAGGTVGCCPKISFTVIEQAESRRTVKKNRATLLMVVIVLESD